MHIINHILSIYCAHNFPHILIQTSLNSDWWLYDTWECDTHFKPICKVQNNFWL